MAWRQHSQDFSLSTDLTGFLKVMMLAFPLDLKPFRCKGVTWEDRQLAVSWISWSSISQSLISWFSISQSLISWSSISQYLMRMWSLSGAKESRDKIANQLSPRYLNLSLNFNNAMQCNDLKLLKSMLFYYTGRKFVTGIAQPVLIKVGRRCCWFRVNERG